MMSWQTMANKGLILIMVIGLIVLLVFSGTIITVASGLFAEVSSGIAGFFGDLGNGLGYNTTSPTPSPSTTPRPSPTGNGSNPTPTPSGGGNPTPTPTSSEATHGAVWFAFTFTLTDGRKFDLNMDAPQNPMFSLFPLSISWTSGNGCHISSMEVLIRLKLTGSNLGSWSTTSSQHVEIYFNGASKVSSTGSFSASGNSWTSGEMQTIQITTMTAETLTDLFNQNGGNGAWDFQVTGTSSLTINGQQYSVNMSQNDIVLTYDSSLSIAIIAGTHLTTFPLTRTR